MSQPLKVLLVEDNARDAELLMRQLNRLGYEFNVTRVDTEESFLQALNATPDLVLSDFQLPTFDGLRALRLLRERDSETPFILISGTIGEDLAVTAMKLGATDYLLKDRLARLGPAISHAFEEAKLRRERLQAQGDLAASEARYRMLIEQASDGIAVLSSDGRYEEVNLRFAEMLGYERRDLTGARMDAFVVGEDQPRIGAELGRVRRHGFAVGEWRMRQQDGAILEIEVSARQLPDGRTIAIIRDITTRKKAEAQMRRRLELEARLSRLAAAAPGAIWSMRFREDGVPIFPEASPQLEELSGLTLAELARNAGPAMARVHRDDRAALRARIEESRRAMTMWAMVFRYQHPTNGLIWIEARSAPTVETDGGIAWHGFMMDVSDRKVLEEQLRQAQKMEAIGQLAAGVAHDFNNLLTVIQGNAALIAEERSSRSENAYEISQAAERAATLTRQLLLFSRKQEIRAVDLDLNVVVSNMTKLLRRVLGEDIVLEANLADRPAVIHADAVMIEQVLLNLAVNSRDAMPNGGTLTITTGVEDGEVEPRLEKVRRVVCLKMRDSGEGIPPDVLPRIFEPFFTTKGVGKGTGLGLATVYAIVKQHGGAIKVDSEVGEGTTFDIALPGRETPDRPGPAPGQSADQLRGSETILVVEDEQSVRLLVGNLLERSGYRVLSAESGLAALRVFERHQNDIELLLTDMVMPDGMSGRELARRLLERRPDLKVIYTSGYSADVSSAEFSLVPGHNFIQKPYAPGDLARTVRAALDRPRARES